MAAPLPVNSGVRRIPGKEGVTTERAGHLSFYFGWEDGQKTHEKETPENRLGKAVILGHLTLLLSCLSFSLHFFNKTPPTCQSLLPFTKVKVSSCFGGSGVIPSPFDLGHLQLSSSRDLPAL